jgi:ribosomal protein L27
VSDYFKDVIITRHELENNLELYSEWVVLFSTKKEKDQYNDDKYQALPSKEHVFHTKTTSDNKITTDHVNLKKGTKIMITRNFNIEQEDTVYNIVNGDVGFVTGFRKRSGVNYPMVKLKRFDKSFVIQEISTEIKNVEGDVLRTIRGIPIEQSWATTIHKAQSLSMDKVIVDLTNSFAEGQNYVAMSRARSKVGIKLIGFDPYQTKSCLKSLEYYDTVGEFKELLQKIAEYFSRNPEIKEVSEYLG